MFTYFVRRSLGMVLTLLIVSVLVFVIMNLPDGDYFAIIIDNY